MFHLLTPRSCSESLPVLVVTNEDDPNRERLITCNDTNEHNWVMIGFLEGIEENMKRTEQKALDQRGQIRDILGTVDMWIRLTTFEDAIAIRRNVRDPVGTIKLNPTDDERRYYFSKITFNIVEFETPILLGYKTLRALNINVCYPRNYDVVKTREWPDGVIWQLHKAYCATRCLMGFVPSHPQLEAPGTMPVEQTEGRQ